MKREVRHRTVEDLVDQFPSILFPEYQRDATVWNLDAKQKLLDSILREFDISSLYFFSHDGELECIDGRQRLNALMSFWNRNPEDDRDNGFSLKPSNEIAVETSPLMNALAGAKFEDLRDTRDFQWAYKRLLRYKVSVVELSEPETDDEFNLQFLRLNLGALINAGEKLNAMMGEARDLAFAENGYGQHPFLGTLGMPRRRFARELTTAQIMLQVDSFARNGEFTRARHFDLQRYFKLRSKLSSDDRKVLERIPESYSFLDDSLGDVSKRLRSRPLAVSVVLLVAVGESQSDGDQFHEFLAAFLGKLEEQVAAMRRYDPDPEFQDFVDFQKNLTQASVEKPALSKRHEVLANQWVAFQETGSLQGRLP